MKAEIRKKYESLIRPEWVKARNCANVHQVPLLRKIVLNMGLGKGAQQIASGGLLEAGTELCDSLAVMRVTVLKPMMGMII